MVTPRYQTALQLYPYVRSADQDAGSPVHYPVIIVGAGPVGLALALDLGRKGVGCLLLDDHDGVGVGSRAICFAKRTLDICDRLGCVAPMIKKGVQWNLGRVYRGDAPIYAFNLLPEAGHKHPAFINLQQTYFEQYLVDAIRAQQGAGAPIALRGENRVTALTQTDAFAQLEIDTPDGSYQITADYVAACDGAGSPIRGMLGLEFEGRTFEDNFLIADIRTQVDMPIERRFWFDPLFNPSQTALLHKQPDDVWRLDFQLGWDVDRQAELDPDRVKARVSGMIGPDVDFDLVWTSIYTFRCCSMKDYRHGRVFFAGDSAHQVSPFGARGANGGIQDADNLGWKLAMVLKGDAPDALLDSYQTERKFAAEENIRASSRTADFLTPRSYAHALFRDAVLDLAKTHAFARPMVNSGRLSVPCRYECSPLNGVDHLPDGPDETRPGNPCPDARVGDSYLLEQLGDVFTLLAVNVDVPADTPCPVFLVQSEDAPDVAARYLGRAEAALYLIRPDQHVAARWPRYDPAQVQAALTQALATEVA